MSAVIAWWRGVVFFGGGGGAPIKKCMHEANFTIRNFMYSSVIFAHRSCIYLRGLLIGSPAHPRDMLIGSRASL